MKQLITTIFLLMACFAAGAQNDSVPATMPDSLPRTQDRITEIPVPKSTPVDVDDRKPVTVLHYYDKHGDPLDEPVMFLATLDTVQKVKSKPVYPVYSGINIGANFGDLIFMAFGQRYASFDYWPTPRSITGFSPLSNVAWGMPTRLRPKPTSHIRHHRHFMPN